MLEVANYGEFLKIDSSSWVLIQFVLYSIWLCFAADLYKERAAMAHLDT
jgi:hypothetical protein